MSVQSPVTFVMFNRPELTRLSFARIAEARPSQLFLIADGPRDDVPSDTKLCSEVRSVVNEIDWPCTVHRNFADRNMGLKNRFVTGLTWVFSQVERSIILEDDCVAHPDFFEFCDELLARYEDETRVGAITGNNFQSDRRVGDGSYYFSKFTHIWGWATWSRVWARYDPHLSFWPHWKRTDRWKNVCPDPVERRYFERVFDRTYAGEIDTWDYQLQASIWQEQQLTATPNENLVANIGFGPDATHTKVGGEYREVAEGPLGVLTHPDAIEAAIEADRWDFDKHYGGAILRDRRTPVGFLRWLLKGTHRRLLRFLGK